MKISILITCLTLAAAPLLTSCGTTGGQLVGTLEKAGGYIAAKEYLGRAKTASAWEKKHDKLARFRDSVEEANRTGITAATLQPAVDAFVKDDLEAVLVADVLSGLVPENGVLPLNQPDVARFTAGVTLALARTNPYVATK